MPSTQRLLANSSNAFAGAILTASSVKPVSDAVLSLPRARAGSAMAKLSGLYAGQEEAFYEVEITDTTVTTPLISQPVFTGAGTGSVSGISYAGSAQSFTVKLADLGQVLTAAGTDIEGASLVARTPGADGNAIRLHVDLSGLNYEDKNYSLLKPLGAGSSAEGAEYDWDTKVMGADGQIPANAHRLVFGEDTSVVYTQYKQYKDGKWLYNFEPAIQREIPTGTRIRFVSGSRTVTVSDGLVTEAYPGIVTLYDLLSAIQASSALVKVEGVIANDRAPGGMASRDLLTRTDAHSLAPYGEGSQYVKGALQGFYASATAPTELVEIRCWANSPKDSPNAGTGRELWQVKGSVSGVVAGAYKTGDLFAGTNFGFQIPVKLPDGFGAQRGRFSVTGISYAGRESTAENPPICVASMALGPDAFDQQLTLVYKKRPSGACACKDMAAPDLSGKKCLIGTTITTGGGDMEPGQLGRLSRIGAWHRDFVESNTALSVDTTELRYSWQDMKLAGLARDAFTACLDDLYTAGTLAWPAWAASAVIARYAIIQIGDDRLQASNAGATGATIPTVPATEGATVVDGTVTWVYLGKTPELMWDDELSDLITDMAVLETLDSAPATLNASNINAAPSPFTLAVDDLFTAPTHFNNYPIWNPPVFVPGAYNVSPGSWTTGHYSYGLSSVPAYGTVFKTTGAGFTTANYMRVILPDPTPAVGEVGIVQTSVDGAAWTNHGTCVVEVVAVGLGADTNLVQATDAQIDDYAQRYAAAMDAIRAAAGISKKDNASPTTGDGCWRDTGASYWWEITGQNGAYAPAFTNEPYFSSRDAGEGYFSTHEFAFQINVKCEASLLEGDTIQLSIGDAGWPSTYQVGDTLYLPIIAAQDLYLAGGKNGDNIQTWNIDGSASGAFPPYLLDLDAPLPYSSSGLGMQITPGGIPFEAGDSFKFTVEGGHYKWRKMIDGAWGAWSATAPVGASLAAIDSGLSLLFQTGAAPSFAAGDLYKFRALQPYALSNAINPDPESWRWSGAGAILTANLGSDQPIDACSLSFHDLPDTALVTLQGGADGVVWDWSESIPWRAGVMAALFAEKTASWLKLTIANATDASIGWAWAGQAVSTEFHAECLLSRDYRIERGAGLNPSAAYLGAAMSGTIEWQVLRDPDMAKLMPMLDSLKQNDDQPMILIPQSTRPEEAYPVRVDVDMIDAAEDGGYQSNLGNERRYTMKLNLKGVVA